MKKYSRDYLSTGRGLLFVTYRSTCVSSLLDDTQMRQQKRRERWSRFYQVNDIGKNSRTMMCRIVRTASYVRSLQV